MGWQDVDPSLSTMAYRQAAPFPHIVIDGLFPEEQIKEVAAEVRSVTFEADEARSYGSVDKRRCSDPAKFPPKAGALIFELNSPPFLAWLEKLTGIEGLEPDPTFAGGGIHQIGTGGLLRIHTDFNWHEQLQRHRRANLILYLNEDWQEEWGGNLELWDEADIKKPEAQPGKRISPVLNRMVVFSTTDYSYHGHPEPLRCPPDRMRSSIALYYYSKERPQEEVKFRGNRIANYAARPGDSFGRDYRLAQLYIRYPMWRRAVGIYHGARKMLRPLKRVIGR